MIYCQAQALAYKGVITVVDDYHKEQPVTVWKCEHEHIDDAEKGIPGYLNATECAQRHMVEIIKSMEEVK